MFDINDLGKRVLCADVGYHAAVSFKIASILTSYNLPKCLC